MARLKRLNVQISEDLVKDIDVYAESLHINRTSAVSVLLSSALNANKAIDSLNTMTTAYKASQPQSDLLP